MWCRSAFIYSILLLLCWFLFIESCEALKSDDDGVCVVKISSPKTRKRIVQVTLNRRCGKRKCVGSKVKFEKYMETLNRIVCCNGWEYNNEADKCYPLCTTGCMDGECVAPDRCQCEPPLFLDPEHVNICYQPICDEQCVHGYCTPNNTCSCKPEHSPYNATHCIPHCNSGYTISSDLSCVPICDNKCLNGNCTAPNTCACFQGYEISDKNNFTCEPICKQSCVNADCVAPNTCSCHEGYILVNETNCMPKCENCENGECVAPNNCKCHEEYIKVDGVCKPKCTKKCVNGICSAPDVCSCAEGYHMRNETDAYVCHKPCPASCNGTCNNFGDCVEKTCKSTKLEKTVKKTRQKSFLVKLNKMCGKKKCTVWKTKSETYIEKQLSPTCCAGWEYVADDDSCRAQCRYGCRGGRCVAPNDCRCDPPLVLKNNNSCVEPTCEPPCVNSQCIAPNTCSCNLGYIALNTSHCGPKCPSGYVNDPLTLECTPKCEKPCNNGTCVAPDTCSCVDGYKLTDDPYTCAPECKPSCVNADCIAPNICSCSEGYKAESRWKCRPICDICDHGNCVAPNTCECHEGYSKKDAVECTPDCERPCSNGFCSEPDICTCNSNYTIDPVDKYNCLPICNPKCVNAFCVSPNTCSCHSGYITTGNNWSCKPKCDDCDHGECVAPNECRCHKGYSKKAGDKCTPDCDKNCSNGYCSEPNVCTCNMGYKIDPKNRFTCLPICEPRCVNASCELPNNCTCLLGYEPTENNFTCKPKCMSCKHGECIAPENCRCNEGYSHDDFNEECSPICSNPCINGFCSSPSVCSCKEGYMKNDTEPSICYKPCAGVCDHGACNLDGECICDRGYELDNGTCITMIPVECGGCDGNCTDDICWCRDGRPCFFPPEIETTEFASSTTSLAGLEMTWVGGGVVGLLLFALLIVVIQRTWRKRNGYGAKTADEGNPHGSVVYTVPNTLMQRNCYHDDDRDFDDDNYDCDDVKTSLRDELGTKDTTERLLNSDATHM